MWNFKKSSLVGIALIVIITLGLPYSAECLNLRFTWSPPTTGSPVVLYEFAANTDSTSAPTVVASSPTNVVIYDIQVGTWYLRVRGVDEFDRKGPWSWAARFVDAGTPSRCGAVQWSRP